MILLKIEIEESEISDFDIRTITPKLDTLLTSDELNCFLANLQPEMLTKYLQSKLLPMAQSSNKSSSARGWPIPRSGWWPSERSPYRL